jgi:AmmeMemoRadiSam system protein A
MTSEADRRALLSIARSAIVAHTSGRAPSPTVVLTGALAVCRGAFVTLHTHGELRGCIGHLEADEPLATVVSRCAVLACSADHRFAAVSAEEVAALQIELSLLGPLIPVTSADEVEIGRDGLVVEERWHRGLLLPQVAIEWQWDRETLLAQTCRKAGLVGDAWKRGARVWRFEAEVFAETL